MKLLYRHALGEISWLIDIAPEMIGHVVGEKLEDDDLEKHFHFSESGLEGKNIVINFPHVIIVGYHAYYFTASGFDFLDGAAVFSMQRRVSIKHDRGKILVYEGERAMFEFSARVGFGMAIGQFFELEGSFHGDRKFVGTSEEEKILIMRVFLCYLLDPIA